VCTFRKKTERLGLEVVDPKAHRTTTSLQIHDGLPSVEEVLKESAGALDAARMANHDKVDVQARARVNDGLFLRCCVGLLCSF